MQGPEQAHTQYRLGNDWLSYSTADKDLGAIADQMLNVS